MPTSNKIIWPVSIRLIHWLIALSVLLDAFVVEEGDPPHRYLGYGAMALVVLRTWLGIWGSGHVRFSSMPLRPSQFTDFFRNHFRGKHHAQGHNPLASLVYILIWGLILALGVTGWMLGLDAYWGDEGLEKLHAQLSDGLVALVVVHLLGLALDAIIYKRKTWMGMIDGREK